MIRDLYASRYFDGPDTQKIFTHKLDLLKKGHYRLIGRLVALSLIHDGPGLHFFSGELFSMMVGDEPDLIAAESQLSAHCQQMIKQVRFKH